MKTKTFEGFLKNLSIYDNEGETFDRITIIFNDTKRKTANGYLYTCLGCSFDGFAFFQHGEAMKGRHLGKKISFDDLSGELQQTLKTYFKQLQNDRI